MKIGFVINDIRTEVAAYATVRLARSARNLGHDVWLFGVADFIYDPDGSVHATAATPQKKKYKDNEELLEELQDEDAEYDRILIDELDVLLLRNDPAEDATSRPWAQTSAILFGKLAIERGVLVLNDPSHLAYALNKTYFQHFPEQVRPDTCIARDTGSIRRFIEAHDGSAVIKPLQGSGGQNVFLVQPGEEANLNQMVEAVLRDGYAIVQEYLPAARDGDMRLIVMNGRALQVDGKYAAFRRVNKEGDARSNVKAGGKIQPAEPDERALRLVDMVRPKLVQDGMYLVGLDIVGDKLMEINVFSPGGIGVAERLYEVNFADQIIADLERKTLTRSYYGHRLTNAQLATL
ncbi:MAG TPA: glutathione synthetase [Woeseiaceae bacterium]|jgi:glutathione synthase|nr:glutathione synthetase [Woeseiaceae bacterium]